MILERDEWVALAAEHRATVTDELADVIYRRDRGLRHPVDDFLFRYYNLRPSQLAAWHPGAERGLAHAPEYAQLPFYHADGEVTRVDRAAFRAKRGATMRTALRLLRSSADIRPRFGCFGMHEWAMVYRLPETETRHPYLKLRFAPDEIAAIVEDIGCRCTHFDAFRFFTPAARPLNQVAPTRETQADLDQPGCLHVNMDLYKWAGKLVPHIGSGLLWRTFRLAREIRTVDMQASAYDLSEWGYPPIKVETAQGRARYVALQRDFAQRAEPLRHELISALTAVCPEPAEQ